MKKTIKRGYINRFLSGEWLVHYTYDFRHWYCRGFWKKWDAKRFLKSLTC